MVSVSRSKMPCCSASVELAAADRAAGRVLDVAPSARHLLVGLLDADDVEPVAGKDFGDAGAHRAEADDADGGELSWHVGESGTPSRLRRAGRTERPLPIGRVAPVRLVIARCQVDYAGRLTAHLPMATRLLIVKADGSVLVHSDGGSYKPLNWMSPPCTSRRGRRRGRAPSSGSSRPRAATRCASWSTRSLSDSSYDLGIDPGLQKDGVEKHLQELLADHPAALGDGLTLVRREYPTAIGPVDLLCRDAAA